VKNFSNMASPLTNLFKKAIKFEWVERCEMAFQELRQQLTTVLILTLPVEENEYTIYSDALRNVLGFVLMIEDKVIAYAYQQLKPYKRNCSNHDLELALWSLH